MRSYIDSLLFFAKKEEANMYVYINSERGLWTVGFYTPTGEWVPESDYNSPTEAAERVAYLNGGGSS